MDFRMRGSKKLAVQRSKVKGCRSSGAGTEMLRSLKEALEAVIINRVAFIAPDVPTQGAHGSGKLKA